MPDDVTRTVQATEIAGAAAGIDDPVGLAREGLGGWNRGCEVEITVCSDRERAGAASRYFCGRQELRMARSAQLAISGQTLGSTQEPLGSSNAARVGRETAHD